MTRRPKDDIIRVAVPAGSPAWTWAEEQHTGDETMNTGKIRRKGMVRSFEVRAIGTGEDEESEYRIEIDDDGAWDGWQPRKAAALLREAAQKLRERADAIEWEC